MVTTALKPYHSPRATSACPCCQAHYKWRGPSDYATCDCGRRTKCLCCERCLLHCASASASVIDHSQLDAGKRARLTERGIVPPVRPEGWRGRETER